MEIYNEVGYDLLDPNREVSGLEDLPRVQAMEGDDGEVHLRNLALHKAATEEDALNLVRFCQSWAAVRGAAAPQCGMLHILKFQTE